MKNIILSVPSTWNYTPTDLMIKYSKEHHSAEFKRIWLNSCLIINGIAYIYDFWKITKLPNAKEVVTLYLKELKK